VDFTRKPAIFFEVFMGCLLDLGFSLLDPSSFSERPLCSRRADVN